MKKISFKDIFVPSVSLFLICIVVAFLLAGTNELTKGPISEQEAKNAAEAMKNVCPEAEKFEGAEGIETELYRGFDKNGELVGYAINATEKGYGGDIEIMVGINLDGEITGVEILSINETPGLGMNATKEEFRSQFLGEIPDGGFTAKDDSTGTKKQIDALTGATISSEAVSNAVNHAVDVYNALKGGGD